MTSYTHDAAGNRLSITYPDNTVVASTYSNLGYLLTLTDTSDTTGIVYTRDPEGQLLKEAHSDGTSTEYAYNAAGLQTQLLEVDKAHDPRREIRHAAFVLLTMTAGIGVAHMLPYFHLGGDDDQLTPALPAHRVQLAASRSRRCQ